VSSYIKFGFPLPFSQGLFLSNKCFTPIVIVVLAIEIIPSFTHILVSLVKGLGKALQKDPIKVSDGTSDKVLVH